jgi:hypothetical protein
VRPTAVARRSSPITHANCLEKREEREKRMRKCVVAAALVSSALPVGAIAESAQAASVADFYELAKPTGKGPFPAVVLAPGCGGFHDEYSPPVFDKYRTGLPL